MAPKRSTGIMVDEDAWRTLKVFCAQNQISIGDKSGEIIEEWVQENCGISPADQIRASPIF